MFNGRSIGDIADCPDVADIRGRAWNGRYAPEVIIPDADVGCGHLRPRRAGPLHREGLVRTGIGLSVGPNRPHVGGGDRRHPAVGDGVIGQTRVGGGDQMERRVTVVHDSWRNRKSTRLNSSHMSISYAV